MPLTLPNGSTYKLCLLDTNALSEIVKYPTIEGRGYIERFPPNEYVPCFTVYNLFELRRKPKVFYKFVKFFRVYPSLLTHPTQRILEAEISARGRTPVNDIMSCAFTQLGPDLSYDFAMFIERLFNEPSMLQLESDWRNNDQEVLDTWQANKVNFTPTNSVPNRCDANQFVNDACVDTLCQIHPQFVQYCINTGNVTLLQSFPSLQVMLYSQYYRIFDTKWNLNDQEVTDVRIAACAPYVDAVVTEKRQAEIYKKIQRHIEGMSLQICKLSDIRYHA